MHAARAIGAVRAVTQELRGEVRAVRPNECLPLRFEPDLFEEADILKRAKEWTVQAALEVDFAHESIGKMHFYHVVANVSAASDDFLGRIRSGTDQVNGRIFSSGRSSCLRRQFSNSSCR